MSDNKPDPNLDQTVELTQFVGSHEDLLEAVKSQVEYYFSKENLQSDVFLLQHMDAMKSVPLSVIMKVSYILFL